MKIGDLVQFKGTWTPSATQNGRRWTGVVTEVWTNGRTRKLQGVDILWDNGEISKQFGVHNIKVINENR